MWTSFTYGPQARDQMQRRSFLKAGIASAVALLLVGGGLTTMRSGISNRRLSAAAREVFAAVARAVLEGTLPTQAAARDAVIGSHVERIDAVIAGLPPATQRELGGLLTLLTSTPGRLSLAGLVSDWSEASTADIQAMLRRLRFSAIPVRQRVYHTLRDITNVTYFTDPAGWAAIGYPGPRVI